MGWVLIILGVIQLTGGFSLIAGNTYGRVIGIIGGSLGAIGALLSIGGSYPWWSLGIFSLCVWVVYGIIVFGEDERRRQPEFRGVSVRGTPRVAPRGEMVDYRETLRRLALNDERFVESVLGMGRDTVEVSRLDQKTHALVRLAASLAIDAAPSSYQANVEVALAAGASIDEVVGSLIAVAPTVGLARVVSAAPELALALGYDVEAALETPGEPG